MRLPVEEHLNHEWRVHSLASDFDLLDVWRFPIELDNRVSLDDFLRFMLSLQRNLADSRGATGALFRLRRVLGRLFGWDDESPASSQALPIPGCVETTIRARLTDDETERMDGASSPVGTHADDGDESPFKPVYQRESEFLSEISNSTVHALLHLGRVSISETHWSPQMGVYVKARGRLGRFYMGLIAPFRHYIVYPAMMRAAEKRWPDYAEHHLGHLYEN